MYRRGQVTVFVIAGVVIAGILLLAFGLRKNLSEDVVGVESLSVKTLEVKQGIEQCLSSELGNSLYLAAASGGTNGAQVEGVAVYTKEPSLDTFKSEISKLLKPLSELCLKEYGGKVSKVELYFDDKTSAILTTGITVENERVNQLRAEFPLDFASAVAKIRDIYRNLGDFIVLTEGATLTEVGVDGYQVYTLAFPEYDVHGLPLTFHFAVEADANAKPDLTLPEIREEVFKEFDPNYIAEADEESGLFEEAAI